MKPTNPYQHRKLIVDRINSLLIECQAMIKSTNEVLQQERRKNNLKRAM